MSTLVTATSTGGPAAQALARNSSSARRQLGRRVGHEHERICRGQESERRGGVGRVQPAHPGRVHQRRPLARNGLGTPTSTSRRHADAVISRRLLGPMAIATGSMASTMTAPSSWRWTIGGRGSLAHHGHGHRREVVVDRADAGAEQRVDQRTLALLELADDAHHRLGPGDPFGGTGDGASRGPRRPVGRATRSRRRRFGASSASVAGAVRQAVRVGLRQQAPFVIRPECTPPRVVAGGGTLDSGAASRSLRRSRGELMAYSLGIDLGTTYSAAATAHDDRVEIFQLGERAATIPSIVVLRADGEVLTGDAAERRALAEPTRTGARVQAPPRRPDADHPGWDAVRRGGAARASAAGDRRPGQAPSPEPPRMRSSRTPPGELRRLQDRPAASRPFARPTSASVTLLTEPEAAAVSTTHSQERVPAGAVIAVYDFGGGTFDATILRKTETRASSSSAARGHRAPRRHRLRRGALHRVMACRDVRWRRDRPDDPATMAAIARLREECRRAKEALSSDTDTTIAGLPAGPPDARCA